MTQQHKTAHREFTEDQIRRNAQDAYEAACREMGVTVTDMGKHGEKIGASIHLDKTVTDVLFGGLLKAIGMEPSPEAQDVVACLEQGGFTEQNLPDIQHQLDDNPPESQIAVFARYDASDGRFRSLVRCVVGPNCKAKDALTWTAVAIANPESPPGARLEPLGYADPRSGLWRAEMPSPWKTGVEDTPFGG